MGLSPAGKDKIKTAAERAGPSEGQDLKKRYKRLLKGEPSKAAKERTASLRKLLESRKETEEEIAKAVKEAEAAEIEKEKASLKEQWVKLQEKGKIGEEDKLES